MYIFFYFILKIYMRILIYNEVIKRPIFNFTQDQNQLTSLHCIILLHCVEGSTGRLRHGL